MILAGLAGRQVRTYLLSPASRSSGSRSDPAGGSLDQADDDRMRGAAGADRRYGVAPTHAQAGCVARAAQVGRCADSTIGRWDDRGRISHATGRVADWLTRRGAAMGAVWWRGAS